MGSAAVATTGTLQGTSRRTLNSPPAGILVRSNTASANPISQLPNTPVNMNTRVKRAASQKLALRNGDLIDAGEYAGLANYIGVLTKAGGLSQLSPCPVGSGPSVPGWSAPSSVSAVRCGLRGWE